MFNTTPPRNVIYYNDNTNPLSDLFNTAYTDVILGFMAVDPNTMNVSGDGGAFVDGNLQNDIVTLQNAGKNVLISLGGDNSTFLSSTWKACAQTVLNSINDGNEQNVLVQNIVEFIVANNLNGIDIDYEDDSGFDGTGGYDGVAFLVELTGQLFRWLPPQQNIITHAPQTPYWVAQQGSWTTGPYVTIWQEVGDCITWFNNQFYDQGTLNDALTYYPQFVNTVPPAKMLVGTLLAGSAADGFIGLNAMMNVLSNLQQKYQANFGGAMGWEFSEDTPDGAWGSGIAQALSGPAPAPPPLPTPGPTPGNWSVNDLTAATNAPAAAGDPDGYVFTANGTSGMHVVYRGVDNDIHELYWQNGAWSVNDLTAATDAPAAGGDPNGFTFTANGTSGMHVVYRGADDDIQELYSQNGAWGVNDLTAATDAPAAAGDPNGFTFTANGTSGMHVVYRGADNDIHELYWQNGAWGVNDLTAATNAPPAAGDPNGFTFTANGTSGMHVVYRGVDNDIHELYWENGAWSVNDLTAGTNAPAAVGDPNGYVFDAQEQMHVVYPSADGHIDEFWWAPASTSSAARRRAVKPSRDAKGAMGKAPAEA